MPATLPGLKAPRRKSRSTFTKFSKAVKDSIGLSFGMSGKDYCPTSCRVYGVCYAERIERIYKGLSKKLARHYWQGPTWVVNRAIAQFPETALRWARVSVDGSLPTKADLGPKKWKIFVKRLRVLIGTGHAAGAQWHFPTDTPGKARSYRAALRGTGVCVRRTSQAPTLAKVLKSTDPLAWVVADRIHDGCVSNDELAKNTELAKSAAKTVRKSGKTCVVCPAITSGSHCGQCTACANSRVDVVLYPFHP